MDAIVHDLLRYPTAAAGVHTEAVDGGAAEAGWAMCVVKELQVQLHLEVDREDIIRPSVGRDAATHANDGMRAGGNEDLAEDGEKTGPCNGEERVPAMCAGALSEAITGTLEGAANE